MGPQAKLPLVGAIEQASLKLGVLDAGASLKLLPAPNHARAAGAPLKSAPLKSPGPSGHRLRIDPRKSSPRKNLAWVRIEPAQVGAGEVWHLGGGGPGKELKARAWPLKSVPL